MGNDYTEEFNQQEQECFDLITEITKAHVQYSKTDRSVDPKDLLTADYLRSNGYVLSHFAGTAVYGLHQWTKGSVEIFCSGLLPKYGFCAMDSKLVLRRIDTIERLMELENAIKNKL